MGLKKCQIYFDNYQNAYICGQAISGSVEIELSSDKKIKAITFELKGKARTSWSETTSSTDMDGKDVSSTRTYSGEQKYFKYKHNLLIAKNNDAILFPAGRHVFKFSYKIPTNIPSSFEGQYGFVRYTAKVTLDRPWKFDQIAKAVFIVISPLDLNVDPRNREPAKLTLEKTFWFRSGSITAVVKAPCSGFVCGQIIPLTIEIDNASKIAVYEVSLKLMENVTFYTTNRRDKKDLSKELQKIHISKSIPGRSLKVFFENLAIPSTPPSYLENCHIIDINYYIQCTLKLSGCHKNAHGLLPIIIGTIPLNNVVPMKSMAQ